MTKNFITTIFLAINFLACKKTDSANGTANAGGGNNETSPTAITKPQYNNTSFGVYKGVVAGSTGFIVFTINNGDNVIKGYLTIDNTKDTLTTAQTLAAGQPIVNVRFTGRISSMTLSANADGSNARLTNIQISGHSNPAIFVIHENSTKQIYLYEGTFNGVSSGVFNCARAGTNNGDTAYVLARFYGDTTLNGLGQVINSSTTINLYRDTAVMFVAQGSFSADSFNGTLSWGTGSGGGTFTCTRSY
jgi:hypothetical protein